MSHFVVLGVADEEGELRGLKSAQGLWISLAVVLVGESRPDAVVVGGDCAGGSAGAAGIGDCRCGHFAVD